MSLSGVESEVVSEVIAVCNELGHKNRLLDNQYILNKKDSNNVIKDLIRFLRNDDKHRFYVRKQLGFSNIVDNDLIPIVEQYSLQDIPLFDKVLRLLVDLTNPTLLLFHQKTPKDKTESQKFLELQSFLYSYKQSFSYHKRFWTVLAKHLTRILELDEDNRQIEDTLMFERILILIRNVLHIPMDTNSGQTTEDGIETHDRILDVLHSSGINDLLLFLTNDDSHQDFCFHLIEIISLIFKEQNAEFIAKSAANYQQNSGPNVDQRSDFEREVDRKELKELKARDESLWAKSGLNLNRFNGVYCIKNMKSISNRDIVCHKTPQNLSQISFDANKDIKRKAKNRQPMADNSVKSGVGAQVIHKSSPKVRKLLYDFSTDFLNNSYNQFMRQIRDNLSRNLSQENDETYYLWSIQFFMEFNRTNPKAMDNTLVSETMSISTFHYLQTQIEKYLDLIKTQKEDLNLWSKRLHYGLKAYRELLFSLNYLGFAKEEGIRQMATLIKRDIFYEVEYRDLLLLLLDEYNEVRMSKSFLKDLIETNHVFLKMLENYYKSHSRLVVREKVRKRKKKSQKKPKDKTPPEEIWNEIVATISEALSGSLDLPSPQEDLTVRAFDPSSDKTTDEQKMEVFRRINNFLKEKRVVEAIALYRDARNCWTGDEDNAFGAQDIPPEEELLSLNEVLMTEFPNETKDEEKDDEEVDEELENVERLSKTREREVELKEVVNKYCQPNIVRNYALLLRSYDTNSSETNHCLVKMLHRIAFDSKMYVMLFQASLFRTFQRILSNPLKDSPQIKDLSKFAKFIVSKFVSIAEKNKKVFTELLFWKNIRESNGIEEGFDQVLNTKVVTKQLWTEEQELELQVLYEELKDKSDGKDKDYIDLILEKMIDETKTRRQLIRQLKQQGLYTKIKSKRVRKGPKNKNNDFGDEVISDDSDNESIKEFGINSEHLDNNHNLSDEDIDKENNESIVENTSEVLKDNENNEIRELSELSDNNNEINEKNSENIVFSGFDNIVNDSEDSSDGSVVLKIDETIDSNEKKRSFDDSDDEEIVVKSKKRRQLITDESDDEQTEIQERRQLNTNESDDEEVGVKSKKIRQLITDESDDEEVVVKSKKIRQLIIDESDDEEIEIQERRQSNSDESDGEEVVVKSKRRRKLIIDESDED